jgi:hypothetical protein
MFLLNLLFDFNNPSGLFSDLETAGVPLLNSKHWLTINQKVPGPGFDAEAAPWEDLGELGTLLIPHGGAPANRHAIGIRVAPIPAVPAVVAAGATLDISVAFGRPVVARQLFASPFEDPPGVTKTLFQGTGLVRAAGAQGWFFPLTRIDKPPASPVFTNRFEFALGIAVTSAGVTKYFGEDPEFDVGT